MPALTSDFCQWLLHQDENPRIPCAIVLHGDSVELNDSLIYGITDYLNEYDEEATGGWLAASRPLLTRLSIDSNLRRLLGLSTAHSHEPGDEQHEWPELIHRLAGRGRLVCIAPSSPLDVPNKCRIFHAAIGHTDAVHGRCHISIDPEMALTGRLPQIISDVFLEWNNCHERHLDVASGA